MKTGLKTSRKMNGVEHRIVGAAMRVHYWFMQPTDRDERNSTFYNKAMADLLRGCGQRRKALGKKPPSPRTAVTRLE